MRTLILSAIICLAFVSCKKQPEVRYYQGWLPDDYYEFTIRDTIIYGKIFDTYHRDIDTIKGYITKDSIGWDINTDRRDGSFYYNGSVDKKGNIHLDDSLSLKSISKKEFDSITKEAFHPKLKDMQKVFVKDDYIFHIYVKGWDYHDYKGTTYVFIKDRKTKKLIQTIKSKDLVFNNELFLGYDDVNFDGKKDLAFYIGELGNYGAPANDYYLFNPKKQRFEYNSEFSFIKSYGSESNEKDKTITSYSKGSCCTHYADKYKIEGDKFTKIKKMFIESAGDEEVTVEELKDGKWQKTVKHYSIKEARKIDFYKGF